MVELTEVMPHRGDYERIITLLKKVRDGHVHEDIEHTLKLNFLNETSCLSCTEVCRK